jgi:hypothetical protein
LWWICNISFAWPTTAGFTTRPIDTNCCIRKMRIEIWHRRQSSGTSWTN